MKKRAATLPLLIRYNSNFDAALNKSTNYRITHSRPVVANPTCRPRRPTCPFMRREEFRMTCASSFNISKYLHYPGLNLYADFTLENPEIMGKLRTGAPRAGGRLPMLHKNCAMARYYLEVLMQRMRTHDLDHRIGHAGKCLPLVLRMIFISLLVLIVFSNTFALLLHQAKNITVSALLLLMIIQMMAMPIAYLDYTLNKKFIAEKLCVNKNKPALKCGGHCFFMKQLQKANENENSANADAPAKTISLDYFEETTVFTVFRPGNFICLNFGYIVSQLPANLTQSVFHPPSFS